MGALKQLWKVGSSGIDSDVAQRVATLGITDKRVIKGLDLLIKTFKGFNSTQSNFINLSNPDPKVHAIGAMWLCLGNTDTKKSMNFLKLEDSDTAFRMTHFNTPALTPWGYYYDGVSMYSNLHVKPYSHLKNRDNQLSVYFIGGISLRYNNTYKAALGCYVDVNNRIHLRIDALSTLATWFYVVNAPTAVGTTYDSNNTRTTEEVSCATRIEGTLKAFRNGITNGGNSYTGQDGNIGASLDIDMFVGAYNNAGSATGFQTGLHPYLSTGCSIVDALQIPYNNAIKRFTSIKNPNCWIYGDSEAYGTDQNPLTNRWSSQFSLNTGCVENNFAVAFKALQAESPSYAILSMEETLTSIRSKTKINEYTFLEFGANDIIRNIGTAATFKTIYRNILNYILTKGWDVKDLKVLNIMPVDRAKLSTIQSYNQSISELQAEFGFQLFDAYDFIMTNNPSYSWWYLNGVHLTTEGHTAKAAWIVSQMQYTYN